MQIDKSVLSVVIMAVITLMLRCAPFVIFSGKKETPKIIIYLGKVLPSAVMGMLVIYCLKDTSFTSAAGFVPQLVAGAAVVGSYIWKKSTLISIVLGTAVYMVMV